MKNRQKELMRLHRMATGRIESWMEVGNVMSSQTGHYNRCVYHCKSYPLDEAIYKKEAVRAVADLIVQCQIACEELKVDFDEVADLGFIAFRDEMANVTKKQRQRKGEC